MNFNEALRELNCEQLWGKFIHEILTSLNMYDFKTFESKQNWALICANTLLGHEVIMKEYYGRLLDNYLQDCEFSINRLGIQAELAQELLEERRKLPKLTKTISGNEKRVEVENREEGLKTISRLETMMELCEESKEHVAKRNRTGLALTILSKALDDAEKTIEKQIITISETYDLPNLFQELGQQQGPSYFRGKEPIYSGPQNVSRKPSGDKDFIMSESECWCIYCNSKIEKSAKDKMSPCEHLVCVKCSRMLSSKVVMCDDKRIYDYGLPKHPHASDKP